MEFTGDSIDAILHRLYRSLQKDGQPHTGSRGKTVELLGISLRIRKPLARISRSENRGKPFSALGELLWYLSGSDRLDFIERYVPAYRQDAVGGLLEGAYGPRLLSMRGTINQFKSIETLLTAKPGSRRAVIQLFNAEDIATTRKEIPCTTTLQFHLRDGRLHLSVTMRSNDAYLGLPHDVFCFTMIQEMMARCLGVELGEYYQFVGSMHIYKKHLKGLEAYVHEGVQKTHEMPAMPAGDPFSLVGQLLSIERRLREGEQLDAGAEMTEPYWADVVRLLQVFWVKEIAGKGHIAWLKGLREKFHAASYLPYVDGRMAMRARAKTAEP